MLSDLLRSSRLAPPLATRAIESLAGKVAIVTGGDSPLARAVALCLAYNGADIVLAYRHEETAARDAVRRIHSHGANAVSVCGDIDDPEFARQVADAALDQFEQVDAPLGGFGYAAVPPVADESARFRGAAIAAFGEAVRETLAAHGVRLRAMTHGPVWSPLVPTDPETDLPVNQHHGSTGPCFVFVARQS